MTSAGEEQEAPDDQARQKQQAAEYAVGLVSSGMVVGLGSGTTAIFAIRRLRQLLREKVLQDIQAFPPSAAVEAEAHRHMIPLVSLDRPPQADLTIDGADEVDPQFNLIKGGGGALLREKIVAQNSRREV